MIIPDKVTSFKDIRTKYSMTRDGNYAVNVDWTYLEDALARYEQSYGLELEPDFQRAHVWNDAQRTRYVEYVLRGGKFSRTLYFNCPGWMGMTPGKVQLVDGLQRLTAVRKFMAGELKAFGSYLSEYTDSLRITMADFIFAMNDLATREEVLTWYIDLNAGGVAHTSEEIERVRALLEEERAHS